MPDSLIDSILGSNLTDECKQHVLRAVRAYECQTAPSRVLVGVMLDLQRTHGTEVRLPVTPESLEELIRRMADEVPTLDISSSPGGGAEIRLAWRPRASKID